jgi:acyl CoA:acetate/3-ketoacid CoA transferase
MSIDVTDKFVTAEQAAQRIPDGATVAITGSGGGLLEADALLAAIERRFLAEGHPRQLTLMHAQGLGDGAERGLNRLAHEGLVKRVIGAHWSWSPRMQQLAADNKIEAYAMPGGAVQHLIRESGAGRPGLITPIGLDTMADPRRGGCAMNARATEALNEIVQFDGQEFIRYKPVKVDVAILRGSLADAGGNVSFVEEGAELDALVLATAAHNCGGIVLVQVRARVERGTLPARQVRLPGVLVDAVVAVAAQAQSHASVFDPALAGTLPRNAMPAAEAPPAPPGAAWERQIIGARAARFLRPDAIVSFGFGIPDEVATIAARDPRLHCHQTVDHGHHGGQSLQGELFGYVRRGEALIDSPSQFDFYSGRGIDIAFLGFGEFDAEGNVNVSRLGGKIIGPGGFIDIAQGSRTVVFCGTFEAKGLRVQADAGALRIASPGQVAKLVRQVEQVTFSGRRALATGQQVYYVTERALFQLTPGGVALLEVAPGIDLQREVLDRMRFAPVLPPGGPGRMAAPPYFQG